MGSTELRLILLGAGIILIIGIYAWEKGKRRRRSARARVAAVSSRAHPLMKRLVRGARTRGGRQPDEDPVVARDRSEPSIGDVGAPDLAVDLQREPRADAAALGPAADPAGPASATPAAGAARPPTGPMPEVLVVTVAARVGERFSGDAIMSAGRDVGMVPGDMDIFHLVDEASDEPLLGMANMVEPGTFPFRSMSGFSTPGLALFARLPAMRPPLEVYESLLETAERVAALLNGRLQDERRRPLTREARDRMRQRLAGAVVE